MIPPSMSGSTLLQGAAPRMRMPPQSPRLRLPAGFRLVKTIGSHFSPLA